MSAELLFEIAGDQIDGARDYQEDAFLTTYLDDNAGGDSKANALVVMADGMGGHAAGNIASNLVVSTFNKRFTGNFGKEDLAVNLRDSLEKANGALRESIRETPALDGMGCTMVTAALSKGKVNWVSVGDSHMYLIRDRELIKKNEDHSYGGYLDRMKAQGMEVEAEAGLSRNMLMSAMTGDEIAEVDCPNKAFSLQGGDRLVVASDGLDTLSSGTILQTSAWSSSAKECAQALLKAVEEANKPRQDNTTVVVIDVLEAAAAAAPAQEAPTETKGRDLGDTQPLDPADLATGEPAPVAAEEETKRGGGKGPIIAIAAAVLVAAGVGAFFVLGGKKAPAPAPAAPTEQSSAQAPAPTPAPVATVQPAPAPAAAPVQPAPAAAPAPAVAPVPAQTAQAEPAPAPATPAPAAEPAPPAVQEFRDSLKSGGEGPVMVTVPAGSFEMGSSNLSVAGDERPRHPVKVKSFAMSKYEVTMAEYEKFASATGRKVPDTMYLEKDTHPVLFVTWDDAYNYAQWLSSETGKDYRLASEAQWEYAAASGATTPYWWGYDVGENNAHCFDCKTGLDPRKPTRVGRFPPNAFGLHDTAGNVSEWVHDCYHPNYTGAPGNGGVWEGGDCSVRMTRGGAYSSTSKSIRSQKRAKYKSQNGYDSVGIRVVSVP